MASMASRVLGAASSGPVVTRRVGGSQGNPFGGTAAASSGPPVAAPGRLKPSVRQTVESIVSTGSQAEYFNPDQTIILFDWDDTLCPSHWIRENRPALSFFKACPTDEKYQKPLRELQVHVLATLQLAMKLGKVVIVTNAMDPWVETSCRNFLPQLLDIVLTLPVLYARSIYEANNSDRGPGGKGSSQASGQALPGMFSSNGQNKLASYNDQLSQQSPEMAPQRWKELAFEQEITGFYSRYAQQSWKNIISIGDSIFERDAVRRVIQRRPMSKKCHTKTTKLLDEPDINELVAQVKIIHDALGLMVQYDGNLDIEIDEEDLKLDLALADKIMDR